MDVRLLTPSAQAAAVGRGIVLIGVTESYYPGNPVTAADLAPAWDRTGPLRLAHLGLTEGNIAPNIEEAISTLTLDEHTGSGAWEANDDGPNVRFTIPFYGGDPRLVEIVAPVQGLGAGYPFQRPVDEYTIVIVPNKVLYDRTTKKHWPLLWNAVDGWQLDINGTPTALTAAQESLFALTWWLWRVHFANRLAGEFPHANGGKAIVEAQVQCMINTAMPEGHWIFSRGDVTDPAGADIDLDGEE